MTITALAEDPDQESDLTDLAELEESIHLTNPSPRRLRSKGEKIRSSSVGSQDKMVDDDIDLSRRVTPMRKAKTKVGSMKEEDTEEEEDELVESDAEEEPEEVDQLVESPTPKATKTRRTPLKRRLRSKRLELETPSDGDDEESDDESVAVDESVVGDEDEDIADDETVKEDSEEEGDEDSEKPTSEPRVLRNGKVVGDDDDEEDEGEDADEEDEELTEEDAEGDDVEIHDEAASIDLEDEEDEDEDEVQVDETDEPMEEDGESKSLA